MLDHLCHREGFSGPGDTEQHLVLVACFDATDELVDSRRLVTTRLIIATQLEFHRGTLRPHPRAVVKPSLYACWEMRPECQRTRAVRLTSTTSDRLFAWIS